MSHEEKINYMRIAAGICGYGFKNEQIDLLVSLYEVVLEKKEKASVNDFVKAEHDVKTKSDVRHKQDLLDKVSEKV